MQSEKTTPPVQAVRDTVRAYARLVRQPSLERIFAFEQSLSALGGARNRERMAAGLRGSPGFAVTPDARYEAPAHRLADLAEQAPGTLGHAYYRFMTEHQLTKDSFPPKWPADEVGYWRMRYLQCHDVWHTVLGYPPDPQGEIRLLSFAITQQQRCAQRERLRISRFHALVLLAGLTHLALFQPRALRPALGGVLEGIRRGMKARPLWAVRWEELWGRPLSTLQAELGVAR